MTAQGLIDKRTELLDGEIYDMPSDGDAHIEVTMRLAQQAMATLLGKPYFVGVQTTLRLSTHNAPTPDIYVLAGGAPKGEIPADRILLVIEVADTSLADDVKDSASRYARHGVRDYWVVDVNARAVQVHREPKDGAYPPPRKLNPSETLTALLIPDSRSRSTVFPASILPEMNRSRRRHRQHAPAMASAAPAVRNTPLVPVRLRLHLHRRAGPAQAG